MKSRDIVRFARAHHSNAIIRNRCVYIDVSCAFSFAICFEVAASTVGLSYVVASIQNLMLPGDDVTFTLGDRCRTVAGSDMWKDSEIEAQQLPTSPQYRLYSALSQDNEIYSFIKSSFQAGRGDVRFLENAFYSAVYFEDEEWVEEAADALENAIRRMPMRPWEVELLSEIQSFREYVSTVGIAAARLDLVGRARDNRRRIGLPCTLCDSHVTV